MTDYIVNSKGVLNTILETEKNIYLPNEKDSFEYRMRNPFKAKTYKLLKNLRTYEFMCYKRDNARNILSSRVYSTKIKFLDAKIKKLGLQLKIEIKPNCVDEGVRICHPNVILNGYVGNNCVFHGNNVLGNKITGDKTGIPKLGSCVDVGIGAIIIGDIEIADNCIIGAGAVVTKSFTTPGSVIAGVPAKLVK